MAKARIADSTGRSNKVRLLWLDADLSDGSVTEMMTTLTNAIRGSQVIRTIERAAVKAIEPSNGVHQEELNLDEDAEMGDVAEADVVATRPPSIPKVPSKRVYKQPEPLDLDFGGNGVAFVDFAKKHAPRADNRRYLVAAAWFKEHGDSSIVDINRIYTAYRTANWPYGHIKDWDQVFRTLCGKQAWMRRVKGKRGEYEATTIGLGRLQTPEE